MARKGKDGMSRPCIATRVRGDLKDRLERAAANNARSIGGEVEARLLATFEDVPAGAEGRTMAVFWAWFDGLSDAHDADTDEGELLALIRRRLEHATGTRAEVVAPQPPKLVQSA